MAAEASRCQDRIPRSWRRCASIPLLLAAIALSELTSARAPPAERAGAAEEDGGLGETLDVRRASLDRQRTLLGEEIDLSVVLVARNDLHAGACVSSSRNPNFAKFATSHDLPSRKKIRTTCASEFINTELPHLI